MNLRLEKIGATAAGGRFDAVDALKGVAILLVVIYHAGGVLGLPNVVHGEVGVDVFFLLSGFLLAGTPATMSAGDILARRAGRIFPAYWIVLALFVWGGTVLLRREISLQEAGLHLAGLQSVWRGAYYSPINDSFWFISAMLGLYLVFLGIRRWWDDALALAGMAGLIVLVGLIPVDGLMHLAPRLAPFFLGMLAGRLLRTERLTFGCRGIFMLGMIAVPILGWGFGADYLYPVSAVALAGGGYVLHEAVAARGGRIILAPWRWLGRHSYEIYLLHQPLIRDYNLWFHREFLGVEPDRAMLVRGIIAALGLTLGLAWVMAAAVGRWQQGWHSSSAGRRWGARAGAVILPGIVLIGTQVGPKVAEPAAAVVQQAQVWYAPKLPQQEVLHGWNGPVRIELLLPAMAGSAVHPVLVTGKAGAADMLGLRRLDAEHVQLVFDHWGYFAMTSEPVATGGAARISIEVSFGSLWPPADAEAMREHPAWRPWSRRLLVRCNGRTVLEREMEFHPADPAAAIVGLNPFGGSLLTRHSAARLLRCVALPPAEFSQAVGF